MDNPSFSSAPPTYEGVRESERNETVEGEEGIGLVEEIINSQSSSERVQPPPYSYLPNEELLGRSRSRSFIPILDDDAEEQEQHGPETSCSFWFCAIAAVLSFLSSFGLVALLIYITHDDVEAN